MYFVNNLMYRYIAVCVCLLLAFKVFSAGLTTKLSHRQIVDGDNFQLILSNDKPFAQLDLTEIQKQFNTYGVSKGRSVNVINGNVNRTYSLSIHLSPKKQGKLTVPSIKIGDEHTQELIIDVLDPLDLPQSDYAKGIELQSSADKTNYFELEDISIQLKLTSDKPLYNGQLYLPTSDDYEITLEKEGAFRQEVINNQTVWVIENQYKIEPKILGEFTLKPFRFEGLVKGRQLKGNVPFDPFDTALNLSFDFGGFAREKVRSFSQPLTLKINPKPKDIKGWFLPANNVTITDNLQSNHLTFKQGEPIARKIHLTAYGARPEQLPELDFKEALGAKVYVESDQVIHRQINGENAAVREVLLSVIPAQQGKITLPEISVKWFDIKDNQEKIAVLASRELTIQDGSQSDLLAKQKLNNEDKTEAKRLDNAVKTTELEKSNETKDKKNVSSSKRDTPSNVSTNQTESPSANQKKMYVWVIALLVGLISLLWWYLKQRKAKLYQSITSKNNRSYSHVNVLNKYSNNRQKLTEKQSDNQKKSVDEQLTLAHDVKALKVSVFEAIKHKDEDTLYQVLLQLKRSISSVKHNRTYIHMQQILELSKYQSSGRQSLDFEVLKNQAKELFKSIGVKDSQQKKQLLPELHPHQKT